MHAHQGMRPDGPGSRTRDLDPDAIGRAMASRPFGVEIYDLQHPGCPRPLRATFSLIPAADCRHPSRADSNAPRRRLLRLGQMRWVVSPTKAGVPAAVPGRPIGARRAEPGRPVEIGIRPSTVAPSAPSRSSTPGSGPSSTAGTTEATPFPRPRPPTGSLQKQTPTIWNSDPLYWLSLSHSRIRAPSGRDPGK